MILEIAAFVLVLALIFFAYVIGLNVGYRAKEYDMAIEDLLLDEEESSVSEIKTELELLIEKHDGLYFVYDAASSKFLAHGKTKEQIETVLVSRFPNVQFSATEENLREVGFL